MHMSSSCAEGRCAHRRGASPAATSGSASWGRRTGARRRRPAPGTRLSERRSLDRPEVLARLLRVALRIVDPNRDDHELCILRLVVPHATPGLRRDADRLVLAYLDDLVVQ